MQGEQISWLCEVPVDEPVSARGGSVVEASIQCVISRAEEHGTLL